MQLTCFEPRSDKIMDPEVPHALRLQGILVGAAPHAPACAACTAAQAAHAALAHGADSSALRRQAELLSSTPGSRPSCSTTARR